MQRRGGATELGVFGKAGGSCACGEQCLRRSHTWNSRLRVLPAFSGLWRLWIVLNKGATRITLGF